MRLGHGNSVKARRAGCHEFTFGVYRQGDRATAGLYLGVGRRTAKNVYATSEQAYKLSQLAEIKKGLRSDEH